QVLVYLDGDGARALDLVAPGIWPGRMREGRHVGKDRMRGDGLGCRAVAGKPGEWRRELVNGREEIERRLIAGSQMQVKLVDGLEIGDLEEQRAPTGKDMGRSDRQHVVPWHAGMVGRELGRAIVRAVMVIPSLGEMAVHSLSDGLLEWKREVQEDA